MQALTSVLCIVSRLIGPEMFGVGTPKYFAVFARRPLAQSRLHAPSSWFIRVESPRRPRDSMELANRGPGVDKGGNIISAHAGGGVVSTNLYTWILSKRPRGS
jgi:hypothetical protein